MIREWDHLFFPVDPFLRAVVTDAFESPGEVPNVTLRPVSLISDLKMLYDWYNYPLKRRPAIPDHFSLPLLFHYKSVLESQDAQSFLLFGKERAVVQIDLMPSQQDPAHLSYFMPANGYVMHFLLTNDTAVSEPEILIVSCLTSLLALKNAAPIFVPVNAEDTLLLEKLLDAGFAICGELINKAGATILLISARNLLPESSW